MKKAILAAAIMILSAVFIFGCDRNQPYDNITDHPLINLLLGYLTGPRISIEIDGASYGNGDTCDYGFIEIGLSTTTINFTLRNNGSKDLVLTGDPFVSINISQGCTVNQPAASVIPPSGTAAFSMTFLIGDGEGPLSALMQIPSNAGTFTLNLGCTAVMPYLVLHGGNSTASSFYHPISNTFTTGLTLPSSVNYGCSSFKISSGTYKGHRVIVRGSNSNTALRYNPNTMTIDETYGWSTYVIGDYSKNFLLADGRVLVLCGGATYPGFAVVYDPVANSFSTWGSVTPSVSYGSHAIRLDSDNVLFFHGASATVSLYQDPLDTFNTAPSITNPVSYGAHSLIVPSGYGSPYEGQVLTIRGGSNELYYFNGSAFTLSTQTLQGSIAGLGAHSFLIEKGQYAGYIMIIHGAGIAPYTYTTLYRVSDGTTSTGPLLSYGAGAGAHSFPITHGPNAGAFLVVHSNGSATTSLYRPVQGDFVAGPALTAAAYNGTISFKIK